LAAKTNDDLVRPLKRYIDIYNINSAPVWHMEGCFPRNIRLRDPSQFSQPSGMKLFKVHVPGEQMQAGMSLFQTMMAIFVIIGPIFDHGLKLWPHFPWL
jgi:hypothetical protein